jgi:hypothetical protein
MVGGSDGLISPTSIEVYCDGSISPAAMENLASSKVSSTFIGRILILIPELDYGILEQVEEGIMTSKGNPDSTHVEVLAAKRASEICSEKGIANYVILTDSLGAAEHSGIDAVIFLEPGKLHYASLFLERVLSRARYLRHSSRKVLNRAKPNKLQEELYQMFVSKRYEIQLSKNLLWQKIQMERPVAGGSSGLP